MKVIGARNYALLEIGAKTCGGNASAILSFIGESLYVDEYDTIEAFLRWCEKNDKWFGWGNYEQRFQEFLKSENMDG